MNLLIVNYHYVREIKSGRGIYPITSAELTAQIDLLAGKYKFISQSDLSAFIAKGSCPDGDFCLLTFDDGLKEQIKAFEILREKGIPGIFFVSTMPIRDRKACAVHKFHYVMEQMTHEQLNSCLLQFFPESCDRLKDLEFLNIAVSKYIFDQPDQALVKFYVNYVLNSSEKKSFVDKLFSILVDEEDNFVEKLYMNKSEVIKIANAGMLGSHCNSHEPLGALTDFNIDLELRDSRLVLEEITGQSIYSVSYPFGDKKAVTQKVKELAKKHYSLGITTASGINYTKDILKDPMSLKRISTTSLTKGDFANHI